MPLYSQIKEDLKTAMKAGDQARVDTIRFALSGLNNFQKEKQIKDPTAVITDEEVISVLQKDVKRRKESIEMFRAGKRDDLVAKEEADLAILAPYIPKELSAEEIGKMVDEAIAAMGDGGKKDFNGVMKEVMKSVKGRADGKAVGEVIKTKLGG